MKVIRFKRYIGICQCRGCIKPYDTIVVMYFNSDSGKFYPAHLCHYHAYAAIKEPFITVGRF